MKILVIRFSSIGDIVLTTPIVRCLKQQLNNVELHYCTKIQFKSMIESNPYIDKIHFLEDKIGDLIHDLKNEKFDFVLDLHRNIRTAIIKFRLGVPSGTYDKLRWQRFLFTKFQINFMPNCHVVDRYFDATSSLGIKNDKQGLDYFIPKKDEIQLDILPKAFQKGYVVYIIGASGFTKILPFDKMVELCDKINKPIILVGGKEDNATGEKLLAFFNTKPSDPEMEENLKRLGKKTIIYNACGKFNLSQSASLIKQAGIVFGHDTGHTHIAAAFKKQIFSIWGGTVPNNFYPYGTKFTIIENTKLNCRPCSKSGRSSCPKGHFKCMKDLIFDFNLE